MEIKQLKVFLGVLAADSFTQAAKRMNYAQSTVSDTIAKLEANLGAKLFVRDHKHLKLTQAGLILEAYAKKIIQLEAEALSDIQSAKAMINIGITESLCSYKFPSFFRAFLEKHKSVGLRFTIARCEKIPMLLSEGAIDIGFTIDEPLDYKGLDRIYLFDEPIIFVVGHKHPRLNEVLEGRVDKENVIISEGQTGYNILLEDAFLRRQIKMGHAIYMDSIEGIKSYVKDGFGITFIPKVTVEEDLASGDLLSFEVEDYCYSHQVAILKSKSNKNQAMLTLCQAAVAAYQQDHK